MRLTSRLKVYRVGCLINRNQLKYLCAGGMVLDSLFFAFPGLFPVEFRLLSRYVAVLFAFFIAEGFIHTRNKRGYLLRLWSVGLIMEAGSVLSCFIFGPEKQIDDNIILTYAISATVLWLLDKANQNKNSGEQYFILAVLGIGLCFILGIESFYISGFRVWIEGGPVVIGTILIFYYIRDRKKAVIVFLIFDILLISFLNQWRIPSNYASISDWWYSVGRYSDTYAFLFLPFLGIYNGQPGSRKKFHKWFFYVFYPGHLWILQIISALTFNPA